MAGSAGKPASLPVRTSKTTQKHVFLPEEPQTKPLPSGVTPAVKPIARDEAPTTTTTAVEEDRTDERSDAEKMSKAQREEAGLPRLTAYATADGYKTKLLQAFLKREHGVGVVRVFDDAVYAVYSLPLLPGYGASTKVRSSPAVKSPGGVSLLERMTEAEEVGYHDGFFPQVMEEGVQQTDHTRTNEYLLSSSPQDGTSADPQDDAERKRDVSPDVDQTFLRSPSAQNIPGAADRQQQQQAAEEDTPPGDFRLSTSDPIETRLASTDPTSPTQDQQLSLAARSAAQAHLVAERERAKRRHRGRPTDASRSADRVAEVVFFEYGVTVFFGLTEREERDVLEDCESAGIWTGALEEADWEVEECHYVYDPDATYPRIYNDLFSECALGPASGCPPCLTLDSFQIAFALAQGTRIPPPADIPPRLIPNPPALRITCHRAIHKTKHLRKRHARLALLDGILPQGTRHNGRTSAESPRRAQDDRKTVPITYGRQPQQRNPRCVLLLP